MALSNFKKLATTTLDGKEYMFAIYEDGVEYAPGGYGYGFGCN